jgi:tripartite-type tricarboxylate transporter receptor subunit TctC
MQSDFESRYLLSLAGAVAVGAAGPVFPQTPFYQGKTITLIVGAGPGGMGDLRAKALRSVLAKHIPGNPTITFQYMPGGGGRKAANHLYTTARADGLTLFRISSSIVPYAVLGETGVQYDIDKLIYLGTTEHRLYYLFNTRAEAGLNTLAKLRAATGVRIGSAPVGPHRVHSQPPDRLSARYERTENHSWIRKRRSRRRFRARRSGRAGRFHRHGHRT